MNLWCVYLVKEWRAQRALLGWYAVLAFSILCIGLALLPEHYRQHSSFHLHTVGWFVSAGLLGVLVFVVPALVRGEASSGSDQFVRRLPGALWPSFVGKLAFLFVVTITLPLLGLSLGLLVVEEPALQANRLVDWTWRDSMSLRGADVFHGALWSVLAMPWIWAVAVWMPGGRMAFLGATLLGLVLSIAVFAVLRQHPNIDYGVHWRSWLWAIPVTGLLTAALSWCRGRRGGGPSRSARVGSVVLAGVLLPGALWLGCRVYEYRCPDIERPQHLRAQGITPDARYLLASASARPDWRGVLTRIDLETGGVEVVRGAGQSLHPVASLRPQAWASRVDRYWYLPWNGQVRLLDLQTGQQYPGKVMARWYDFGESLSARIDADHTRRRDWLAPGGVRVTRDGQHLRFRSPHGDVEDVPWAWPQAADLRAVGHGISMILDRKLAYFGFEGRELYRTQEHNMGYFVGPRFVSRGFAGNASTWCVRQPGGRAQECPELHGAIVLGLLDDETLLAASQREHRVRSHELFAFRPATAETRFIALAGLTESGGALSVVWPAQTTSLLPRDPAGGIWLKVRVDWKDRYWRLDPETLKAKAARLPVGEGLNFHLLACDQYPEMLMLDGNEIALIHAVTGARRVLFPRNQSSQP